MRINQELLNLFKLFYKLCMKINQEYFNLFKLFYKILCKLYGFCARELYRFKYV